MNLKPKRRWGTLFFLGVFAFWMTVATLRRTLVFLAGGYPDLVLKWFGPSRAASVLFLLALWTSLFTVWWPLFIKEVRQHKRTE